MTSLVNINTNTATEFNHLSIVANPTVQTMSSKDLLEVINQVRESVGEPIIRLNKFNEKIEDELEGDHYTKSVVQNLNGTESIIYQLNEEQCTLLAMRESKIVRRTVLNELKFYKKNLQPQLPNFLDPAEAAFAWGKQYQATQLAETKLLEATKAIEVMQPTVDAYDLIAGKKGSMCFQDAYKYLGGMKLKDMKQWLYEKKWINKDRFGRDSIGYYQNMNGYLVEKVTTHQPQIRITYKGLAAMARQMKIELNAEDFN